MQFHAAPVAFTQRKGQGVVARRAAGGAGQGAVPGLVARGIERSGTYAGLQENGIETGLLQAVKNAAQFLLLAQRVGRLAHLDCRPVESAQCGEPYGTHFAARRLGSILG